MFEFSEKIAVKLGVNNAIFIEKMSLYNVRNSTYTVKDLLKIFPFWNARQLAYIVKKMESEQFLLKYTEKGGLNGRQITYKVNTSSKYCSQIDLTKLSQGDHNLSLINIRSDKIVVGCRFLEQCSQIDLTKLSQDAALLSSLATNKQYLTVDWSKIRPTLFFMYSKFLITKLYRNNIIIIIYINNIINNIINIKTKSNGKKGGKVLGRNNNNHPASCENMFNAKLILNELNNLIVPECRPRPFSASAYNLGPIIRQLKKGFSKEECVFVVKNMFERWHNTPIMFASLQTKTLFGEKFENYLGAKDEKELKRTKVLQRSAENRSESRKNAASVYEHLADALTEDDSGEFFEEWG